MLVVTGSIGSGRALATSRKAQSACVAGGRGLASCFTFSRITSIYWSGTWPMSRITSAWVNAFCHEQPPNVFAAPSWIARPDGRVIPHNHPEQDGLN